MKEMFGDLLPQNALLIFDLQLVSADVPEEETVGESYFSSGYGEFCGKLGNWKLGNILAKLTWQDHPSLCMNGGVEVKLLKIGLKIEVWMRGGMFNECLSDGSTKMYLARMRKRVSQLLSPTRDKNIGE